MKKTHLWKKDPSTEMFMQSLMNLPTPKSISFLWNFGFMLGMTLMMQIITGLMLSMNFVASQSSAFESVIHMTRDLESGWIMRFIHMNGASLFFLFLFIHISRGLYFSSYLKTPMTWLSGVVILLLSMGSAFLGYVLPWGQMSFWGATVITSMISAIPYIGKEITLWLWGNFSVSQPTLNRFFSLHFLTPLLILMLVMIHLLILHKTGSNNPLTINTNFDKMKFYPYFMFKDTLPILLTLMILIFICCMNPNMLGDVENYNQANILSTPTHIQPEWYFLFAYAILRAVPSKLGGVILMVLSIVTLMLLPLKKNYKKLNHFNKKMNPQKKLIFWCFLNTWVILTWIGMKPVEEPFLIVGKVASMLYFSIMLMM